MADKVIKFVWNNVTYIVNKASNPILLPTGEVLAGDGWTREIYPRHPGNLILVFTIHDFSNIKRVDLLRSLFDFNFALAKKVTEIVTCPNGCLGILTVPFCAQCGARVDVEERIEPLQFEPKSIIDGPVTIYHTDRSCPNCHTHLGWDTRLHRCPTCGISLRWDDK